MHIIKSQDKCFIGLSRPVHSRISEEQNLHLTIRVHLAQLRSAILSDCLSQLAKADRSCFWFAQNGPVRSQRGSDPLPQWLQSCACSCLPHCLEYARTSKPEEGGCWGCFGGQQGSVCLLLGVRGRCRPARVARTAHGRTSTRLFSVPVEAPVCSHPDPAQLPQHAEDSDGMTGKRAVRPAPERPAPRAPLQSPGLNVN